MTQETTNDHLYYVPEISEFRIGFEFEIAKINKDYIRINKEYNIDHWVKKVFSNDIDLDTIEKLIEIESIRVKKLDREDIESIGYNCIKQFETEFCFQKIISEISFMEIDLDTETPEITIEKYIANKDRTYNTFTLFKGTIKNKSELVVLLKQLGI